jgi:uncharacterized protein with gpF-like domain
LPILELLKDPLYNSSDILLDALRTGKLVYKEGQFTGNLNIKLSKELSKFAKFDKRTKSFKTDINKIPHDIRTAAAVANNKSKALHEELNRRLQSMSDDAKERLKTLNFSIDKSADEIESVLNQEFKKIGIEYKPEENIREKLSQNYNDNLKLSIVDESNPEMGWDSEQITRLHDMIEKSSLDGYRRDNLIKMIQREFDISKNKATFLARNETSIFMSELRENRFIDADIDIYQWLTSHDNRVVGFPGGYKPSDGHGNHYILNGKYCKFSDNTIYADSLNDVKNNKWKSRGMIGAPEVAPGREYLCRCISNPIIV